MKYLRKKIKWKASKKILNCSSFYTFHQCFFLKFLVLFFCVLDSGRSYVIENNIITVGFPCSQVLPFNSVMVSSLRDSCSWKCAPDFFLTLPTNQTSGIPTCRKCLDAKNVLQQCSLGKQVKNCTSTSNTECVKCKPEQVGEIYFVPGDCTRTKCKSGFSYGATENSCVPCPENFYCTEREKSIFKSYPIPCPVNCSTKGKTKVTSSLGCNYPSFTVGNYQLLSVKYIISYPRALLASQKVIHPKAKRCFNIDQTFINILEFGNWEKCTVTPTFVETMIEVSCSIILSACYTSDDYNDWLIQKLENKDVKSEIQQSMTRCVFDNNEDTYSIFSQSVSVTRASISTVKTLSTSDKEIINLYQTNELTNNNLIKLEDVPIFHSNKLSWWKNKTNALNVVAFFFIIIGFLCISVFIIIFIFCSVYYKYKFLRSYLMPK